LDCSVFGELKRRNALRELKNEKKKEEKKKKPSKRRTSLINSPHGLPRASLGGANQEEDDMGAIGAEADDTEGEYIRNVCEKEVVTGGNLLGLFAPAITEVCLFPEKYPDPKLRASASLALAKFMLVSSEFCDTQLQLLFTVLERSPEPVIRANMIIASGDLSFRFPNTLEPWTPRMYACLRDHSPLVRANTITVLTHLILNDMIKVKGQISDMALCIMDDVEKISNMAKLFFTELSRKGNALYNVMPDIVSRLSDPDAGLAEDKFREIMKYIIGLIDKDKHLESLVEKLCHRFHATKTERQWRDLAYCLSSFNYNEKAGKKFMENFSCYSDKLHEDTVYEAVTAILTQCKKLPKQETKMAVDELGARVEEARAKGVEDHTAGTRAKQAGIMEPKKKKMTSKTPKRGKKAAESSDEESYMDDEDKEAFKEPPKKSRRSTRGSVSAGGRKATNVVESSEEEKSEDENGEKDVFKEPQPPAKQARRSTRGSMPVGKKATKVVMTSDEEEEEEEKEPSKKAGRSRRGSVPLAKKATKVLESSEEEESDEEKEHQKKAGRGRTGSAVPLAKKATKVLESSEEEESDEEEEEKEAPKKAGNGRGTRSVPVAKKASSEEEESDEDENEDEDEDEDEEDEEEEDEDEKEPSKKAGRGTKVVESSEEEESEEEPEEESEEEEEEEDDDDE
jgi:hypothetical protein